MLGVDAAVSIRNTLNIAEELSQSETDSLEQYVSSVIPNVIANATLAAAAGGTNVCEVTITFKDYNGDTFAGVVNFDVWLSDAATGAGLTGTSASGTVQANEREESHSLSDVGYRRLHPGNH
jgi:hypothetical protein